MDFKSFPFEIKADTGKRTFEGYASTYKRDLVGDQVQQGAFTKTIAERFPKNQIKILYQHSEPIGLPVAMHEDSKGLYVVGRISKTQTGNDALTLMDDGVIDSLSIGYEVVKDAYSEDNKTRLLQELKLYEFSPVTFPANPDTAITAVKRIDYDIEKLSSLMKAGRVFSGSNVEKLRALMNQLSDLLLIAEPDSGKSPDGTQETEPPKGTTSFDGMRTLLDEINKYTKTRS